jgi:hypothetical protein
MNRRQFFAAPLVALPVLALAAPSAPAYAVGPSWRYVGPYCDMGCMDMHIYARRDLTAYAFLTLHRYDDGQFYRGPFPGWEWSHATDMGWLRTFYPEAFHSGRNES